MSNSFFEKVLCWWLSRIWCIWGCHLFSPKFRWQEGLENVSARSMERFNSKERMMLAWNWLQCLLSKFFISPFGLFPGHQKRAWPRKSPQMNWGQCWGNDKSHFGIISPNFLCSAVHSWWGCWAKKPSLKLVFFTLLPIRRLLPWH